MIVQVQFTLKMKLSYYDRSDQVQHVAKIKQDNDMTDCIGLVYSKIETKLSRPIKLVAICDETK